MGVQFLPGHATWCTLLMWASALIGAFIANQLFLPRVIGMLTTGILLRNIPWSAIDAFPPKWGTQMRAAALATIFLRCGLELDFGTMRRYMFPAIRLALIPGLLEALYDAGLGVALFYMPYTLGLCMGFILKAVGPGLVVPAMFRLQKGKMGTDQGIPSTVVISASFDDIVAITGFAIFSTIAIQPDSSSTSGDQENVAWSIASGPLQVVFGLVGGLLAGIAISFTKLWNTHLKRFLALLGGGFLLMFFLEYYTMLSGGALGALFTGLVASNFWEKGVPRFGSLGPSLIYSPECERWMSVLWRWVMEPILFVTIGSTLNFSALSKGTIAKAICIVLTGVTLRMISTYFVMSGFGYTWRERLFYAVAWTPKATVQAALSATPLTLINKYKVGSPDYEQWVAWGNDILTTGLFAIILCGTLGVVAIHFTASALLKPAAESGSSGEEEEEEGDGGGGVGGTGAVAGGGEGGVGEQLMPPALAPPAPPSPTTLGTEGFRHRRPIGATRAASEASGLTRLSTEMSGGGTGGIGGMMSTSPRGGGGVLVPGEDFDLVAEFIDSIKLLTVAVSMGEPAYTHDDVLRLSDRVVQMQQRIESEVGNREPSVRELFRTASLVGRGRKRSGGGGRASRSVDRGVGRRSNDGSGSLHLSTRPKSADDQV